MKRKGRIFTTIPKIAAVTPLWETYADAFAEIKEYKAPASVIENINKKGETKQDILRAEIQMIASLESLNSEYTKFSKNIDTREQLNYMTEPTRTKLTPILPEYYQFADNISEEENYRIVSIDDIAPQKKGTYSAIIRNFFSIKVPAEKSDIQDEIEIVKNAVAGEKYSLKKMNLSSALHHI